MISNKSQLLTKKEQFVSVYSAVKLGTNAAEILWNFKKSQLQPKFTNSLSLRYVK